MNPSKGPGRISGSRHPADPSGPAGFPLSIHGLSSLRAGSVSWPHHSKTRGADPKGSTPHVRGAVLRAGGRRSA